ncbi:MAG: sugar nucleotide-binding protein [Bacteriovoracaceae bacterium]|nr:sugar nucleotide-binding protein [Bacteriovoracaceae bacterium]
MKVLVLGASGFIGNYLYDSFLQDGVVVDGTYFTRKIKPEYIQLDLTNMTEVSSFFKERTYDFIILAAANKNVKQCEDSYDIAYKLNVLPVEHLLNSLGPSSSSTIIFMSSDYVFDGTKGNYSETSDTNPQTNYGKTKLLAEELLLKNASNSFIVRTSAVMGKGGVFFDWLVGEIRNTENVTMFDNIFFTPTPISYLASMLKKLCSSNNELKNTRVLHVVGGRKFSRYEFAKYIKELIPSSSCEVIAEKAQESQFMQKDLSMVSVKLNSDNYEDEYFKRELV